MADQRALVVMVRYPEAGMVKTRLAAACGRERATSLYRAFIQDLDFRFGAGPRRLIWAYHPPASAFASIVRNGARCVAQAGSGLGERMYACVRQVLGATYRSVVLIGADVPHVRDAWLMEAESRLEDVDVVLGPSADGGYYLVAMREPHDIFTGITMSTPEVLTQTRAKIAAAGLRLHLLPESFDVDEVADVERLRGELDDPDLARQLPATAAWLRSEAFS
jgi:rSAM/selenodomain-associated transferase 1